MGDFPFYVSLAFRPEFASVVVEQVPNPALRGKLLFNGSTEVLGSASRLPKKFQGTLSKSLCFIEANSSRKIKSADYLPHTLEINMTYPLIYLLFVR